MCPHHRKKGEGKVKTKYSKARECGKQHLETPTKYVHCTYLVYVQTCCSWSTDQSVCWQKNSHAAHWHSPVWLIHFTIYCFESVLLIMIHGEVLIIITIMIMINVSLRLIHMSFFQDYSIVQSLFYQTWSLQNSATAGRRCLHFLTKMWGKNMSWNIVLCWNIYKLLRQVKYPEELAQFGSLFVEKTQFPLNLMQVEHWLSSW